MVAVAADHGYAIVYRLHKEFHELFYVVRAIHASATSDTANLQKFEFVFCRLSYFVHAQ